MSEPIVYLPIEESDVREPAPPPRPLTAPVAVATVRDYVVGGFLAAFAFAVAAFGTSHRGWTIVAVMIPVILFGLWMMNVARRRRRIVRQGTLVRARVSLMEPEPTELRFFRPGKDALPEGADAGLVQRRTALGMVRASYSTEAGERAVFLALSPGELPVPVRLGDEISAMICLLGSHATIWTCDRPRVSTAGR
jgi:hypothetical protein